MLRTAFFFIALGVSVSCSAVGDIYFIAQYKEGVERYKSILSASCVKGLTLYVAWDQLEPEEGRIDVNILDAWFDFAEKYNKKINIGVFAGMYAPKWVKEKAGSIELRRRLNREQRSIGGSEFITIPNPVSSTVINSIEPLLGEIARRYKSNQAFGYILITGANLTGFTTNISVQDDESRQKLFSQGFSNEKYKKNWSNLISSYAKFFSDKQMVLGVGPVLGNSGINNELVKKGFAISGKRFSIILDFMNSKWFLTTRRPEIVQLRELAKDYKKRGMIGLQMLWWENEHDLLGDVNAAIYDARNFGADWVEIWPQDFEKVRKEFCPQ